MLAVACYGSETIVYMERNLPNEEATETAWSRADLFKSGEDKGAISIATDYFGQRRGI